MIVVRERGCFLTEFICYDDGCHLRKYARKANRKDLTQVAQKLAVMEIVVDKLHMQGHTDGWCHRNCDPNLFSELNEVSPSNDYPLKPYSDLALKA